MLLLLLLLLLLPRLGLATAVAPLLLRRWRPAISPSLLRRPILRCRFCMRRNWDALRRALRAGARPGPRARPGRPRRKQAAPAAVAAATAALPPLLRLMLLLRVLRLGSAPRLPLRPRAAPLERRPPLQLLAPPERSLAARLNARQLLSSQPTAAARHRARKQARLKKRAPLPPLRRAGGLGAPNREGTPCDYGGI